MKHVSHGEVNLFKSDADIPIDAKKLSAKNGMFIIAESEMTGNHHYIPECPNVELFEKDGILYLKSLKETEVKCVIESRHDTVKIESGIWEIEASKEYDYISEEVRYARD